MFGVQIWGTIRTTLLDDVQLQHCTIDMVGVTNMYTIAAIANGPAPVPYAYGPVPYYRSPAVPYYPYRYGYGAGWHGYARGGYGHGGWHH
jgi:hypothetical protein